MRAEGVGEFYAHVAETAESHDADLLSVAHLPMAQRRIGGDAGTEQGSRGGQIQMLWHAQREGLIHDDAFGIAAVGDATGVLVGAVIGKDRELSRKIVRARPCSFHKCGRNPPCSRRRRRRLP